MPAIFVSHGASMLAIDAPAPRFLQGLAAAVPDGLLGKQAWAEDGNTVWLCTEVQVARKRRYVREEQGPDLPTG